MYDTIKDSKTEEKKDFINLIDNKVISKEQYPEKNKSYLGNSNHSLHNKCDYFYDISFCQNYDDINKSLFHQESYNDIEYCNPFDEMIQKESLVNVKFHVESENNHNIIPYSVSHLNYGSINCSGAITPNNLIMFEREDEKIAFMNNKKYPHSNLSSSIFQKEENKNINLKDFSDLEDKLKMIFKNSETYKIKNIEEKMLSNKIIKKTKLSCKYVIRKRKARFLNSDALDKKINIKLKRKIQDVINFYLNYYNANDCPKKNMQLRIFLTNFNKDLSINSLKILHRMRIKNLILNFSKINKKAKAKNLLKRFLNNKHQINFFFEDFLNLDFESFIKLYYKNYAIQDLIELKLLYENKALLESYIKRINIRKTF